MNFKKMLLAISLLASFNVAAAEVMIFSDSMHPIYEAGNYPVIFLDRVQQIELMLTNSLEGFPLSENMSANELNLVRQRLSQELNSGKQQELMDAYAGLAKAWSLGVTHIPAVVKDGYVVYGVANVNDALNLIKEAQQ